MVEPEPEAVLRRLIPLRSVEAGQAHAVAPDLDAVAVRHPRPAFDRVARPLATRTTRSLRDHLADTSKDFPGERLIVCRNPLLAAERQRKREELLAATERPLQPLVAATQRAVRPLRGEAAIGLRVGRVINRYKMAKHFVTTITATSFTFRRDEHKLAAEQALDGLYIVRSNVEPEQFDAAQTVRAYKDLSKVERAFRCLKSVDLKVRPIHHRRPDRVRAHVLLCRTRSGPRSSPAVPSIP